MRKGKINSLKRPFTGLLYVLFFLLIWQCQPGKKVNGGTCSEQGVVQDFSGLDGCQLLIVTKKGKKLLPAEIVDSDFILKDRQKILFSYRELPDQMSICMTEDKIVRITCIQLEQSEDRPAIPACDKVEKIEAKSWLGQLRSKHQPQQIIRYPYKTDGWAYLFTGKEFYLYDCQGTLVRKGTSAEECLKGEITKVNDGVIL